MTRQITVTVFCDLCHTSAPEGESAVMQFGSSHEIDVCSGCLVSLRSRLRPLENAANPKPYQCDFCSKEFGTQRGLSRHKGQSHKEKA